MAVKRIFYIGAAVLALAIGGSLQAVGWLGDTIRNVAIALDGSDDRRPARAGRDGERIAEHAARAVERARVRIADRLEAKGGAMSETMREALQGALTDLDGMEAGLAAHSVEIAAIGTQIAAAAMSGDEDEVARLELALESLMEKAMGTGEAPKPAPAPAAPPAPPAPTAPVSQVGPLLASGARLVAADLHAVDASNQLVNDVRIVGSTLHQPKLSGAAVNGLAIEGSTVLGGAFQNASLNDVDFAGSTLFDTRFNNAAMAKVRFDGVHMERCSFKNAALSGASFGGAQLIDTDFRSAAIQSADFVGSQLVRVRFDGADARGADFAGSRLEGVDLTRFRHPPEPSAFVGACALGNTTPPKGVFIQPC